jgi:hypothetical protein
VRSGSDGQDKFTNVYSAGTSTWDTPTDIDQREDGTTYYSAMGPVAGGTWLALWVQPVDTSTAAVYAATCP